MKLFSLFLSRNKKQNSSTKNEIPSPSFLDGLTENIENPKNLLSHEWRRRLKTPEGQTEFKIKYYGELHKTQKNLIVGTDFSPALIFALDSSTGKEILLFDGCKHGYNAMFCDKFTDEQIKNRLVSNYYQDREGNELFKVVISTYNSIDYDDEFSEEVDENGLIEIIDGTKVPFEKVKRDGYDTINISVINKDGKAINILSEELA